MNGKDKNQPAISDPNPALDNFSSFSSTFTKLCPGGSMTVCVYVCPDSTTRIYGTCVQRCADRCAGQDQR